MEFMSTEYKELSRTPQLEFSVEFLSFSVPTSSHLEILKQAESQIKYPQITHRTTITMGAVVSCVSIQRSSIPTGSY